MWIVSTIADIMDIRIEYLTIIPRARMGSESIAHEAEDRMGYCPFAFQSRRFSLLVGYNI